MVIFTIAKSYLPFSAQNVGEVIRVSSMGAVHNKEIAGSSIIHRFVLAVMLFCFWMLLSGNTEVKFMTYGVLTAVITAWACYPLLLVPDKENTKYYFVFGINPFRLVYYFFWLMWQLVLANVDVIKATVRAELDINPGVVVFRYRAAHPMAQVILANSITLTPGTVTMNVTEDGLFEVHALTDGAADGLKDPSGMPAKVAWLFGEEFEFELVREDY